MPARNLTVTIGPAPPPRLDKALARDVPAAAALSRTRLARLIAEGAVTRGDQVLSDPRARVAEGDRLTLRLEEAAPVDTVPEAITLAVLYEDDELIVLDKPAGMVVHPAPGSPAGTLVNALLHHCGDSLSGIGGERRPGIVHRLDKDTSGVLVAAKTDRAHHALAAQFAAHTVTRRYLALVHGCPDPAEPRLRGLPGLSFEGSTLRIATGLARHRTDRQRQAVTFHGGRHAVTRVLVLERFGTPPAAALVECVLETGRTHQIRVHLAHLGTPVAGDTLYGASRARLWSVDTPGLRQMLHAYRMCFTHPVTGAPCRFTAPLPEDMQAFARQQELELPVS
jgi:23S rRNA pseudouridine1911/1915/1917 synthase